MSKAIIGLGLICLLFLAGCGSTSNYQPQQNIQQEKTYNYEKIFWVGVDSVGDADFRRSTCKQRFAQEYGNSDVECSYRNVNLNIDYSGEGKSASIECVCKY